MIVQVKSPAASRPGPLLGKQFIAIDDNRLMKCAAAVIDEFTLHQASAHEAIDEQAVVWRRAVVGPH